MSPQIAPSSRTPSARSIRRPAKSTGDPLVDLTNEVHGLKTDMAEMEDRLIEHMDERFDAVDVDLQQITERFNEVDSDLKAIKDHLGIRDRPRRAPLTPETLTGHD